MKTIELNKTRMSGGSCEIINVAAIERVTLLSDRQIKTGCANYKGSPLSTHNPSTMAACLAKEKAGILRLSSGAELPLVDEELDAVLKALNE